MDSQKTINIQYFAALREQRGISQETLNTPAQTAQDLYQELQKKYHLNIPINLLKVAINNEFTSWDTRLKKNDTVVFIPPVAGG